jgi:hypothetical protein
MIVYRLSKTRGAEAFTPLQEAPDAPHHLSDWHQSILLHMASCRRNAAQHELFLHKAEF